MVNLFPDVVKHDTPPGRKASYFYVFVLVCSLLAAALYYSLVPLRQTLTASSNDEFFGLEMYQGTTGCKKWYLVCSNYLRRSRTNSVCNFAQVLVPLQ